MAYSKRSQRSKSTKSSHLPATRKKSLTKKKKKKTKKDKERLQQVSKSADHSDTDERALRHGTLISSLRPMLQVAHYLT